MSELIVDNDFIQAGVAFDDGSRIEFETLTSDVDGAIVSLVLEIKELKTKSYWISVDDDLPPLGENYHGAHYSGIHWNCGAFTGTWDDDFRRSSMKAKGYTHWMPLPKPPKGN